MTIHHPDTPVIQLRLVVEAEDFDEAVAFYRDALGLSEQAAFQGDGDARVVILDAGRATLEIANPAQKRMIDDVEVGRQVSPTLRVAFEVADAAATTAQLVEAGAQLVAAATETPWRSLNARLDAPAGLHITVFEELESTTAGPEIDGLGTSAEREPLTSPSGRSGSSVRRLGPADRDIARVTFDLMADVFENPTQPRSDAYIDGLLTRTDFWAIAAFVDDEVVGGLTAHTLPMTVSEGSEVFLFDIAVDPRFQRRGVGSNLVTFLTAAAEAEGIETVFVPADDEDTHALDFYRALGGAPMKVTMFDFIARRP